MSGLTIDCWYYIFDVGINFGILNCQDLYNLLFVDTSFNFLAKRLLKSKKLIAVKRIENIWRQYISFKNCSYFPLDVTKFNKVHKVISEDTFGNYHISDNFLEGTFCQMFSSGDVSDEIWNIMDLCDEGSIYTFPLELKFDVITHIRAVPIGTTKILSLEINVMDEITIKGKREIYELRLPLILINHCPLLTITATGPFMIRYNCFMGNYYDGSFFDNDCIQEKIYIDRDNKFYCQNGDLHCRIQI